MAASLLQNTRLLVKRVVRQENVSVWQQVRRSGISFKHRGLPPDKARSWKQRVEEVHKKDPVLDAQINIGFPPKSVTKTKLNRKDVIKMRAEKNMEELERLSRLRELKVPIDMIKEQDFYGYGQPHIFRVAEHYGVFKDLFGDAYFYPQMMLNISYDVEGEDDMINPVFYGNVLSPAELCRVPQVHYEGDPDKLYTLCMTAPDSHLQENQKEYLHWMVGNIPGSSISEGECLCDYLRPFPVNGTGNHRYVFILYQQDRKIDFTEDRRSPECTSLVERSFESVEWYRKHQDDLTPVSLAFFQSAWDETVRDTFHNVLDMSEPSFEFIHPPSFIPTQKAYPIREPFHLYLDKYRDVKDINEEVLREKLKTADPFKPRAPPRKYPLVIKPNKVMPSWQKMKYYEQLQKKSYWKDLND